MAKKRPLPDWYLEEPYLLPGESFYMEAFWELSTCRSFGNGVGPIPWTAIVQYGYTSELESDTLEIFVAVIRAMDAEYVKWQSAEAERQRKAAEPPKKSKR